MDRVEKKGWYLSEVGTCVFFFMLLRSVLITIRYVICMASEQIHEYIYNFIVDSKILGVKLNLQ